MKIATRQPVLALKPTQFSVGNLEVEYKAHQIKEMNKKELKKFIELNPIPVVVSPWKELCVIDHHHMLAACFQAGIKKVKVSVEKDYSKHKLSYHQFWKKMQQSKLAYLYDQFGEGPRSSLYLPLDVRGMADDPYRSLAWMIRKEGGFEYSEKTFIEFEWADFFRKHRLLESHGRGGFHQAVKKGLMLLKRVPLEKLPGFVPKTKIKTQILKPGKTTKFIIPRSEKGHFPNKPLIEE